VGVIYPAVVDVADAALRVSKCAGNVWGSVAPGSIPLHFQPQNLTRFTLSTDLERAAADLTIRGKPLRCDARIRHQLIVLATIRALNGLAYFHSCAKINIPEFGANATSFWSGNIPI
jgi:hypothetical protein